MVADIFREIRKRVGQRSRSTNDEIPRIEAELKKLAVEISKLADAVTLTEGKVDLLAAKLTESCRVVDPTSTDQLIAKIAEPDVIDAEAAKLAGGAA